MGSNSRTNRKAEEARPARSNGNGANSGQWQGFVNVHLPDGAKEKWFRWMSEKTAFYDAFAQMCVDGYKITVKYEVQNDCYSAFATGSTSDHHDAGWGLSERAGDPFTALSRLVYIHAVVLSRDWSPYKSAPVYEDRWR